MAADGTCELAYAAASQLTHVTGVAWAWPRWGSLAEHTVWWKRRQVEHLLHSTCGVCWASSPQMHTVSERGIVRRLRLETGSGWLRGVALGDEGADVDGDENAAAARAGEGAGAGVTGAVAAAAATGACDAAVEGLWFAKMHESSATVFPNPICVCGVQQAP